MNTTASPLYTNDVSPEYLRTHDKSPFTEQQLSTFNEQALATVKQQQDCCFERALASDHFKVEVLSISTHI